MLDLGANATSVFTLSQNDIDNFSRLINLVIMCSLFYNVEL